MSLQLIVLIETSKLGKLCLFFGVVPFSCGRCQSSAFNQPPHPLHSLLPPTNSSTTASINLLLTLLRQQPEIFITVSYFILTSFHSVTTAVCVCVLWAIDSAFFVSTPCKPLLWLLLDPPPLLVPVHLLTAAAADRSVTLLKNPGSPGGFLSKVACQRRLSPRVNHKGLSAQPWCIPASAFDSSVTPPAYPAGLQLTCPRHTSLPLAR